MTKKSIVLYLSIIGFLLLAAIAWYAYSFYSQPAAAPETLRTWLMQQSGQP